MAEELRRPVALTKLIDTFDRLFPDEPSSRTVVGRSGMEDGMVAYSTRSIENWTNIVNEAIRQNALQAIVETAAELQPNVPELRRHFDDYTKWAAEHVTTPEAEEKITSQKPPGFFERTRLTIVTWFAIAVGCFAFVGIVARESMHHLFALPTTSSHIADAFTAPGESAAAGLRFVGRTLVVAATYFAYNPLGALGAIVVAAAVVYFGVRRPKLVDRAYIPAAVVPLVAIGSVAKAMLYDLPVFGFTGVLTRLAIDPATFDPPAMFFPRAKQIWTGVVCSRIGNFPEAAPLCGTTRPVEHLQNLYGSYLMDVLLTLAVCTLGIAALRKLTLPSHNRLWNLPRTWKWMLVGITAVSLLCTLLVVPWTYARTVASMQYPYVCLEDCEFRICAEDDDCFAFYPPDEEIGPAQPIPANARVTNQDILEAAFTEQVQSPSFAPNERANRLGGTF